MSDVSADKNQSTSQTTFCIIKFLTNRKTTSAQNSMFAGFRNQTVMHMFFMPKYQLEMLVDYRASKLCIATLDFICETN